jgi:hypothetical protein
MRVLFFLLFMPFFLTDVVAQDDKFNGKEYGRLDVYKDNLLTHSQPTNTTFKFKGKKMVVVEGDMFRSYKAKSIKNFEGYRVYDFGTFKVQRHYFDDVIIVENDKNEYGQPCNFERIYRLI